jgi:U4/U6.U5 tri-snRNP-associated protein 1
MPQNEVLVTVDAAEDDPIAIRSRLEEARQKRKAQELLLLPTLADVGDAEGSASMAWLERTEQLMAEKKKAEAMRKQLLAAGNDEEDDSDGEEDDHDSKMVVPALGDLDYLMPGESRVLTMRDVSVIGEIDDGNDLEDASAIEMALLESKQQRVADIQASKASIYAQQSLQYQKSKTHSQTADEVRKKTAAGSLSDGVNGVAERKSDNRVMTQVSDKLEESLKKFQTELVKVKDIEPPRDAHDDSMARAGKEKEKEGDRKQKLLPKHSEGGPVFKSKKRKRAFHLSQMQEKEEKLSVALESAAATTNPPQGLLHSAAERALRAQDLQAQTVAQSEGKKKSFLHALQQEELKLQAVLARDKDKAEKEKEMKAEQLDAPAAGIWEAVQSAKVEGPHVTGATALLANSNATSAVMAFVPTKNKNDSDEVEESMVSAMSGQRTIEHEQGGENENDNDNERGTQSEGGSGSEGEDGMNVDAVDGKSNNRGLSSVLSYLAGGGQHAVEHGAASASASNGGATRVSGRSNDKGLASMRLKEHGVLLERKDEFGRVLTQKEAFREMCYAFHGFKPGRRAQEKRLKKYKEELKQLGSTEVDDLPSMKRLKHFQGRKGGAFMDLEG